jgi:hypothetical protein
MLLTARLFTMAVICALADGALLHGRPPIGDRRRGALALLPPITGHRRGHPPLREQQPPGWIRALALAALVVVAVIGVGLATALS